MTTPPPSEEDTTLDALFAAARAEKLDTSRAEYGFETRLRARLSTKRQERGGWTELTGWCWRLVPVFAVMTLAVGWWAIRPGASPADEPLFAAQPWAGEEDAFTQWLTLDWFSPI